MLGNGTEPPPFLAALPDARFPKKRVHVVGVEAAGFLNRIFGSDAGVVEAADNEVAMAVSD